MRDMKQVIDAERDALTMLSNSLNGQYEDVFERMLHCQGKVVFMGVGKSGHIGEKLAATFASLGIPSFYVHSTEAMHGDLGMIESRDIAVLISNSGNTDEVVQNVAPLKRNGVTTVAFTSGKDSRLAELCDYVILYPKIDEADVLNLAPTVSSTLTLALGDAFACALSQAKGFTRDNFYRFHPNGALGAMLQKENE